MCIQDQVLQIISSDPSLGQWHMEPMPLKNKIKHLFPQSRFKFYYNYPPNNKITSSPVQSKCITQQSFQKLNNKHNQWTNPTLLFNKIHKKTKLFIKIL